MPKLATGAKVRVAIVGAGAMANNVHYPSLASFSDVEIAGICDIDPVRLNTTADKYHVERRFANYRQMIEQVAPDAVWVIGPPQYMYDIWVWCLEHKLNLYSEKPLGSNMHEARMLAYLAEKNDCLTQVSFQRRTCPMVVRLRDECLKRGPIFHAVCRFYKSQIAPYTQARDRLVDDGVHAVDTLRWMCGGELVGVQSVTKRVRTPDANYFSALLEFDNDATGVLMTTWASGRRIFDVEMHAPGICAEAELEGKGYLYADGDTKGIEYDTKVVAGSDQNFVYGGFQAKNREFIDCLRSGKQPGSNYADAVKTMEICETILASWLLEG